MAIIPASLLIVEGVGDNKRCLLEEFPFTIGRAPECHLCLDAVGVSRLHATINRTFGQYTLTDAGSTNGTFVNDRRVEGETPLCDGDEVRLASSVTMVFEDPAATDQIDVSELSLGAIHINEARMEVFVNAKLLEPPLSPSQYALLELLVRHEGRVVTREEVAEAVWPDQTLITDQMIDTLVSRLRKRLAEHEVDRHIVTRRGFGLMYTRH